jgi:dUTP pyrophosphatase
MMKVQIINKSKHRLPEYATSGAAGMDLKADIDEPYVIEPKSSIIIPTGIYIGLPDGYEAQIRSRSGLAFKYDIQAHVGTIDADYTGEIKVKLFNFSENKFVVQPGERIAQMVINKIETIEWEEVKELKETERGEGGFGSTGRV